MWLVEIVVVVEVVGIGVGRFGGSRGGVVVWWQ